MISASSWREGQKLVKKILGPAPRIEQDRRAVSSDRTGRERAAKSGKLFFYHWTYFILLYYIRLHVCRLEQTSEMECSEIEVSYQYYSNF